MLHRHVPRNGTVKPIITENINVEVFQQKMVETHISDTTAGVNENVARMTEALYECLKASKNTRQQRKNEGEDDEGSANVGHSRWERLLHNKGDTEIWKAVDWHGEFKYCHAC